MITGRKRNRPEDWEDLKPSSVIHVRELPDHTLEIDLIRAFERFGHVRDVSMIPNRGQALVEFEDIRGSDDAVNSMEPIYVANRRVKVNFSTSTRIVHRAGPDGMEGDNVENRVLLLTVYNAQYPITVEVIKQICAAHGRVLRIVIFKKAHVQAMVEFEMMDEARRAKKHLNGADIYSGCCTLKVEYARPTRLSVTRNDQDSWDYEAPPGFGSGEPRSNAPNSLLGTPEPMHGGSMMEGGMRNYDMGDRYGRGGGRNSGDYGRGEMPSRYEGASRYSSNGSLLGGASGGYPRGGGMSGGFGGQGGPGGPMNRMGGMNSSMEGGDMGHAGTAVAMVYGLDMEKINCDRLFNVFCIYGNVIRIKFLHSKEGAAMVQMGDGISVDRLMNNLNYVTFFGKKKIQIQPSKQQLIMDVPQPYDLNDGTPSFKDYTGTRNNRYVNVEMAAKNRICPPSRTLHFWNCPPNFTDDDIREVFEKNKAVPPKTILSFNSREKSSAGLLEWEHVEDTVDALSMVNHTPIHYNEGKYPFLLKLSFSMSPIKEKGDYPPPSGGIGDGMRGRGGRGGRGRR